MVKKISITLSDYVYSFLNNVTNKSRFIEELMMKGVDVSTNNITDLKKNYIEKIKENKKLNEQIKKLKTELQELKIKTKEDNLKLKNNEMLTRTLKDNNPAIYEEGENEGEE